MKSVPIIKVVDNFAFPLGSITKSDASGKGLIRPHLPGNRPLEYDDLDILELDLDPLFQLRQLGDEMPFGAVKLE